MKTAKQRLIEFAQKHQPKKTLEQIEQDFDHVSTKDFLADLQTIMNEHAEEACAEQKDRIISVLTAHSDDGREGCTYGDTDFDSISVVHGYNIAVIEIRDKVNKITK